MATVAQIREAIRATLAGVADIGAVNDFERYGANMAGLKAHYQATIAGVEQIRGWNIRRIARRAVSPAEGRVIVTSTWRISGYMALNDGAGSEKAFDTLTDQAVAAFAADETLGGVVDCIVVDDVAGLQIDDTGPVMFGGVLCHSARCRLLTQHFE